MRTKSAWNVRVMFVTVSKERQRQIRKELAQVAAESIIRQRKTMTNPTPASLRAFNDKFTKNTHLDGYGAGTRMAMPCPGCAEPDFLKYDITNTEEALSGGAICQRCGRGFKAVFTKTPNLTSFKIVQTCGPDLPAYQPAIKRLSKPSPTQ